MITYDLEELFRTDSVKKDLSIVSADGTITLTNENIYQESLSITESLCSDSYLIFGSCEASEIKFTTSCLTSMKGKTITVRIVLNNNTSDPFTIGTYVVVEDKLTADRSKREIVAYDSLYAINNADVTEWYEGLTFPLTLSQFRNSFFDYVGVIQDSSVLVNDSMSISKTIYTQSLSGADVIRAICEINGVFGHISRDNVFQYITLSNTSAYSITPTMYSEITYEDYECSEITGVQIRSEENDVGVSVGTTTSQVIIQGNFLVAGYGTSALTPIAQNLFSAISGLNTYKPCEISSIGNLCVEVGDCISVTTTTEVQFDTWIMQREIRGIQALFDTYYSKGEEYRTEEINGIDYTIKMLKGKSNVLERSIEETKSTITNVEEQLSTEITQTARGIEIQIENLQSQIDGEIMYYESDEPPTLLNYPYWDFCTNIPCNNTVQTTNDLKFVYTEQNKFDHMQDLCYDNTNVVSYRFTKQNGEYGWREIADGQTSAIMQRISDLEFTADNLTTEFSEIEKDVTAQGKVVEEHTTKINQTATSISTEVTNRINADKNLSSRITQNADSISTKVEQGAVCSEINQSSEQITLSSNRLVVNSDNFKLASNGNVECSNMKLTGGELSIPADGTNNYVSITRENGFVYGGQWGNPYTNATADVRINSTEMSATYKLGNTSNKVSTNFLGLSVTGMLTVSGLKNRSVETEHYGTRLQNAYETCEPYFGDIGEGQTDENGVCIIPIDEIFAETISVKCGYQVFLQKYGEGDIYVAERNETNFVVKGNPGLKFAWEMKAKQKDYENVRLTEFNTEKESN